MADALIVIRPYRSSDHDGVQKLIAESTLSHVSQFFLHALRGELFFETVFVLVASLFVLTNIPFYWIFILSFPSVALGFFCIIWIAHYYKAHRLHPDLKHIQSIYLASDRTCFWVAEAFGEPTQAIRYELNSDIKKDDSNTKGQIVGTIAIMHDRNRSAPNSAWLRSRLAVKTEWRNKGLGSKLLDISIQFCEEQLYDAITLICTECHVKGRSLYEKKGFQVFKLRQRRIMKMSFLEVPMYFMTKSLKEKRT